MAHTDLDEALELARHLSPPDQERLIACLAREIAALSARADADAVAARMAHGSDIVLTDAWSELARLGCELSVIEPGAISPSEALSAMRR